jgi:hypothetical protein
MQGKVNREIREKSLGRQERRKEKDAEGSSVAVVKNLLRLHHSHKLISSVQ